MAIVIAVICLMVGGVVLSAVQILRPPFQLADPCALASSPLLRVDDPGKDCPDSAPSGLTDIEGERSVSIQAGPSDVALTVRLELAVPKDSTVIEDVRHSAFRDVGGFVYDVFGLDGIENLQPLTIESQEGVETAKLTTQGTISVPDNGYRPIYGKLPGRTALDVELPDGFSAVQVDADDLVVREQSGRTFTGSAAGYLLVILGRGDLSGPLSGEAPYSTLDDIVNWLGSLWTGLTQLLQDGVGAIPWICLALVLRGRPGPNRRLLRTLAAFILLHLAVGIAGIIISSSDLRWLTWIPVDVLGSLPFVLTVYPDVNGGLILLALGVAVVLSRITSTPDVDDDFLDPAFATNSAATGPSRQEYRRRNRMIAVVLIALVWLMSSGWFLWTWRDSFPDWWLAGDAWTTGAQMALALLAALAALVLLLLMAWLVTSSLRLRDRPALPMVAVLAVPVSTMSSILSFRGVLPAVADALVVASMGTVVALAAILSLFGTRHGLRWRSLGIAAFVGVTAGFAASGVGQEGSGASAAWYQALAFARRIDGLSLTLVVIPLAAAVLVGLGSGRNRWTRSQLAHSRVIAWSFIYIGIAGAFSFTAALTVWCAILAAGVAAFLLPFPGLAAAERAMNQGESDHRERVEVEIGRGNARRVLSDARKAVRGKVADGSISYDDARARIHELEVEAGTRMTPAVLLANRRQAFGTVARLTPGRAGTRGALWGVLFGSPWIVLSVTAVLYDPRPGSYPALSAMAAVLPTILQWPFWGFAIWYFFPILRGGTGLGKALWFMAAVFLISTVNTILLGNDSVQWATIAVSLAQFLSFGVLIGLRADLETIRRYGHSRIELADIHNLGTAAGVASTIAVATVTAAAAAVLAGGIEPFVDQLIPTPDPVQQTSVQVTDPTVVPTR